MLSLPFGKPLSKSSLLWMVLNDFFTSHAIHVDRSLPYLGSKEQFLVVHLHPLVFVEWQGYRKQDNDSATERHSISIP